MRAAATPSSTPGRRALPSGEATRVEGAGRALAGHSLGCDGPCDRGVRPGRGRFGRVACWLGAGTGGSNS